MLILFKLIPQQLRVKFSIKSIHTYIKLQGTNVAVYVNEHLSN